MPRITSTLIRAAGVVKLAFPWGGSPDYEVRESWGDSYIFTLEAVIADKAFTDSEGASRDGFVVAIKKTFEDGSRKYWIGNWIM